MADLHYDDLLEASGRQAREDIENDDRIRLDQSWDDYCAGNLDSADSAALLATTADSGDIQLAATLFEPLGEDFKASLADQLRPRPSAGFEGSGETRGTAGAATARPRWLRWWDGFFGSGQIMTLRLAAVAVILAMITGLYPRMRPAGEPIPDYGLELKWYDGTRSVTAEDVESIMPGWRFDVRLQPEEDLEGEPSLRIYVRPRGGEAERWQDAENTATIHSNGAVVAKNLEWSKGPGEWTLYFAIGTSMPPEPELLRLFDPTSLPEGSRWRLMKKELRVGP